MKLLVVIPSDSPKKLASLKWAARAGFQLRIFIGAKADKAAYASAIENANYDDYLDLQHNMLVAGIDPITYATANGFDLLAVIPPNLKGWNSSKDMDKMVIEYAADLAKARNQISKAPELCEVTFKNGTRVIKL